MVNALRPSDSSDKRRTYQGRENVAITQRHIDQIFSDLKRTRGGQREDCFAILYLQQECGLSLDQAASRVAFGETIIGHSKAV